MLKNRSISQPLIDSLEALCQRTSSLAENADKSITLEKGTQLLSLAITDDWCVVANAVSDSIPQVIDSCFVFPSIHLARLTEYLELLQYDLSQVSFQEIQGPSNKPESSKRWLAVQFEKPLPTLAGKIDQWGEPPEEIQLDWQIQSRAAHNVAPAGDLMPSATLTFVDAAGNLIPIWLLCDGGLRDVIGSVSHPADRFLTLQPSTEGDSVSSAAEMTNHAATGRDTEISASGRAAFSTQLQTISNASKPKEHSAEKISPVKKPAATNYRLIFGVCGSVLAAAVLGVLGWWFVVDKSASPPANKRIANSDSKAASSSVAGSSENPSTSMSTAIKSDDSLAEEQTEEMILLDTGLEDSFSADEASELLRSEPSDNSDSLSARLSGEGLNDSLRLSGLLDTDTSAIKPDKAPSDFESDSQSADVSVEELESNDIAAQTVDATIKKVIAENENFVDVQQLDSNETKFISRSIKLLNFKTDFKFKLPTPTSRKTGVCRVAWQLPESLSVEPDTPIEITGEGSYEFLIKKEIEDSKRLAKFPCQLRIVVSSKPGKRWNLTTTTILEFPLQQRRVPISHQQSDLVFNQISNFAGAIQRRINQLNFLQDASPDREVRRVARKQSRLLKRRAKEIDEALDAWTNAASLTNSFFDNEFLNLTVAPTLADLPTEPPSENPSSSDNEDGSNSND